MADKFEFYRLFFAILSELIANKVYFILKYFPLAAGFIPRSFSEVAIHEKIKCSTPLARVGLLQISWTNVTFLIFLSLLFCNSVIRFLLRFFFQVSLILL